MQNADLVQNDVHYLHTDQLGSVRAVIDAAGTVVARQNYEAYGTIRADGTGTMPTDRGFTGQPWDGYINMISMGDRWYDPYLARWISPDSIVPQPGNPQSLNRYSYNLNNPVKYRDPTGHDADDVPKFFSGVVYQWGQSQLPNPPDPKALEVKSDAFQIGRATGGVIALAQGVIEIAGGIAGGGGLCLTGVGCIAGAPAIVGSTGLIVHGGLTATKGLGGTLESIVTIASRKIDPSDRTPVCEGADSRKYKELQLQEHFDHAPQWGVSGNWNRQNGSKFVDAMESFINGPNTQRIEGTFRSTIKATYYLDQATRMAVFFDGDGNYISGWQFSKEQVDYLLKTGNVQ